MLTCLYSLNGTTVKMEEVLRDMVVIVESKDWEKLRKAAVKLKYLQGIEFAAAAWPASVHDQ